MSWLTENIIKSWVTANKGDQVLIISDHENVAIVENYLGISFTVKKEFLSDVPVSIENADPVEIENVSPSLKPRWKKSKPIIQNSLF